MSGRRNLRRERLPSRLLILFLPALLMMIVVFFPPSIWAEDAGLKYKLGATGVTILGSDKGSTRIIIPDYIEDKPVTNIAARAFASADKLEEIILPSTLKTIGNNGFANCLKLMRVDLPEGLIGIGENAFYNCPSLQVVSIPASLESFNPNVFAKSPGIYFSVAEENPHYTGLEGVIYSKDLTALVAARAIDGGSFTVPDTVTAISAGAFYGSGIQTITLGSSVKTIGENAFSGCTQLQEVLLNEGLESIGGEAFAGTESLREIALPRSLTSLGWKVFQASGLERIDLSTTQIETLPYGIFWDCVHLQDIILGDKITVIEDAAFRNGTFTQIRLPEKLQQLKSGFTGCAGLESITLPYTLKNLGSAVFADCTALKTVYFEGNMPLRGDGFGTSIPNDVWTRENDSFSGLPLAVAKELEIYVLRGAQGWGNSFEDFADGSGATSRISFIYHLEDYILDETAEKDNPRLILHSPESFAGLEIGSTSEAIGVVKAGLPAGAGPIIWSSSENSVATVDDAGRVTALEAGVSIITASLYYNGTLFTGEEKVNVTGPETVFKWSVQRDGTAIINGFREGIGEKQMFQLRIPEILAGYKVTAIKNSAFANNSYISILSIPGTVKTIGAAAFSGCTGLVEVTLEEGLKDIGTSAFSSTPIREIVVPQSVTRIQDYAFGNCQELWKAVIKSNNLEYALGTGVFRDCRSLKEVTFAEGITKTGGYTFAGCTSLEYIKLPSTLQALGMYDFSGSTSLKTVELQGYLLGQETGIAEKYNPFAARYVDFVRGIDNKHVKYDYPDSSEDLIILHPDDGNEWSSLFNNKVRTGVRDDSGNIRLDSLAGYPPDSEEHVRAVNPGVEALAPIPINWGSVPAVNPGTQPLTDTDGGITADSEAANDEKESQDEKPATVFEVVKKTVAENLWLTLLLSMTALALLILGGAGRIKKYRQSR